MNKGRPQRGKKMHLALLINRQAQGYQKKHVTRLISRIRSKGGSYTFYEPESALDLVKQAEVVVGLRKSTREYPAPFARGGEVTGMVACGGDGTFNLVARAALQKGLPVGFLPMGKYNNIARSLITDADLSKSIKAILSGIRSILNLSLRLEIGEPDK